VVTNYLTVAAYAYEQRISSNGASPPRLPRQKCLQISKRGSQASAADRTADFDGASDFNQ
jgi:hypothetical protein